MSAPAKAALYCRLSKEDEDLGKEPGKTESESIQNQKALLLRYAREQGFAVYGLYVDEDYSGADRDRPAFNALLRDAAARKFQIILAKSQSRFTRDMELVEKYLHGKFPEWGIRFLAVVDHTDTDDAAGKKARQINGLVNEWYLEDLSANVRAVLTHKRKAGQHIGSFAPYGYRKDPADHNHLLPDPEAAQVVHRIFAMALAGHGVPYIVQTLNREGIPNPTLYKQQQGLAFYQHNPGPVPGLWSASTVYAMLNNRTYAGDLVQGRHRKASYKSKKILSLPPDQWIICPDTHPPLIDKKDFALLQKRRTPAARPCATGRVFSLARKAVCGCCGAPLQLCGNGHGRRYLRCPLHTRHPALCPNRAVPLEVLETLVLQHLCQQLDAHFATERLDLSPALHRAARQRAAQHKARQALQQALAQQEQALTLLGRDVRNGLLPEELSARMQQHYRQQTAEARCHLRRVNEQLQAAPPTPEAWQARVQALAHPRALDRALVCTLVDTLRVGPPEGNTRPVEIHWRF